MIHLLALQAMDAKARSEDAEEGLLLQRRLQIASAAHDGTHTEAGKTCFRQSAEFSECSTAYMSATSHSRLSEPYDRQQSKQGRLDCQSAAGRTKQAGEGLDEASRQSQHYVSLEASLEDAISPTVPEGPGEATRKLRVLSSDESGLRSPSGSGSREGEGFKEGISAQMMTSNPLYRQSLQRQMQATEGDGTETAITDSSLGSLAAAGMHATQHAMSICSSPVQAAAPEGASMQQRGRGTSAEQQAAMQMKGIPAAARRGGEHPATGKRSGTASRERQSIAGSSYWAKPGADAVSCVSSPYREPGIVALRRPETAKAAATPAAGDNKKATWKPTPPSSCASKQPQPSRRPFYPPAAHFAPDLPVRGSQQPSAGPNSKPSATADQAEAAHLRQPSGRKSSKKPEVCEDTSDPSTAATVMVKSSPPKIASTAQEAWVAATGKGLRKLDMQLPLLEKENSPSPEQQRQIQASRQFQPPHHSSGSRPIGHASHPQQIPLQVRLIFTLSQLPDVAYNRPLPVSKHLKLYEVHMLLVNS